MDGEVIRERLRELPLSRLGEIQADHEIWEATDGGAHLKVTRHDVPIPERFRIVALTVSGEVPERARVIRDFISELGKPASQTIFPHPSHMDTLLWRD